ncbi:DNA segregation ATPase FtsK/SpoIIIE, S-DNA-T family [Promicromonospora umidemergens]|uniref:FtsK/SpoIIIE domain-containing protein n=1 Tax=Promicromonospora umidemergens TaxID=629679 RepID=A0ABP8WN03_9MICO|nr:FtsK/SpoIIIE domain-containing protein [Promicromonospora umidemergens]MCP2286837.1 DNA segregation ATPase FtsK/SpoIIIE, S-DNA-T family [Promicromonospora umidemergens]
MTTPNEHMPGTPDDGLPDDAALSAMVYGSGHEVEATRLDQGATLVQPGEDNTLTGEVIDAPPAPPAEDAPPAPRVLEHRGDHEPLKVLPQWATSPEVFLAAAKREATFLASWVGHHGLRLPFVYLPKFLVRAGVGFGLCVRGLSRWVSDAENKATRTALMVGVRGTSEWKTLRKEHADGVRARLAGLAAAGTMSGVAGVTINTYTGAEGLTVAAIAAGTAAVTAFGIVGTKKVTKPILDTHEEQVPKLTMDLVSDALLTLGLGSMGEVKAGRAENKILRIFSTTGGVEIHVDLVPGATTAMVIERKDRLASALRRPLDTVWPENNHKANPGRLNLYIADKALSERRAVEWKLANKGVTNVFEPFPIGEDQRGRPVSVNLMYNNVVVGGLPGMGKTYLLRVLILGAMLDPRTELHIHELKGTGDLLALKPVAHVCQSGDDPDDFKALRDDLRNVREEMRRRSAFIRSLPREEVSESKVTDELANRYGLKPMLFVIDESQLAFKDPAYGGEIADLVEDVTRLGRALGIILILATQRPNKDAIPTAISALISIRICLRVGDQTTNDMVLGTSMYKAGHRATDLDPEAKGVALLAGEKADPQLVRSASVDGAASDKIVERSRVIREAKGLLTGMAAGDIPADLDHSTVVDHLLAVWPENDPEWANGKIWSDELAARLAEHKPTLYTGWDAAQVNAAAKRHGVTAKNVKHGTGANNVRKGLVRAEIVKAAGDVIALPDTTTEED